VTLMLHTFVGDDEERVREIVREPMKGYLRSSIDLVKQAAWSFPAFKHRVDKPGEMDALLNGGLTPADFEALARVLVRTLLPPEWPVRHAG
jgi:hypothetical protein